MTCGMSSPAEAPVPPEAYALKELDPSEPLVDPGFELGPNCGGCRTEQHETQEYSDFTKNFEPRRKLLPT